MSREQIERLNQEANAHNRRVAIILEQSAVAEHSSPITAVPLNSTTMSGKARWLIATNALAG